jgi:hypothetical protein
MTFSSADYWAVVALKARYFRFMDLKQWPELRGIFGDDATFDHPTLGKFERIDEAIEALRLAIADQWTSHEGSIPDIELMPPDRATGIFAMSGHSRLANGTGFNRTFGHYYDSFQRVDGIWKISSIRLVSTLRDG